MAGIAISAALLALPLRSARAEDLLEVYRIARGADPVLAGADAARRVVHEDVAQARAPLLPQASAGWRMDQTRVGGGAPPIAQNRERKASANLSQVLVDVGALARLGAAQAQADAQDASYRAAEQALLLRVATAYFKVLMAGDALANVQANEDALAQQVAQADQRYRHGLSALVDLEQARAYHASARSNTIGAHKELADARDALAEITGTPPGTLSVLRDELPMEAPSPADPQAWVAASLVHNPLLQAQRASVSAAEKNVGAARAGHLPTLSAGVGIGRGAAWPAAGANDGRTLTTLGVALDIPLFSGGAQQSLVRQALHRRDGARDELEARRRHVAREVLEQHRSVIAGMAQTEATRSAVASARKALASTRVGQGLGTQTMTDLLLAIQTLAAAQNAHSQARHQFVLSRLLLQQAAGTVSETDLAAVNALLQ